MSKDQTEGFVCTNLSDDLSNLSIKEIPIQSLSEDSLRISIKAASLNFPDCNVRPPMQCIVDLLNILFVSLSVSPAIPS